MNRKLLALLTTLILSALTLGACGGDDSDEGTTEAATTEATTTEETTGGGAAGGKGGTLDVAADPNAIAYTTGDLSVDSGTAEIDFENPASLEHDVRIEGEGGEDLGGTEVISDSSTTAEVDLEPGTYTYYCSVDGHRQAGMEGTLTVK